MRNHLLKSNKEILSSVVAGRLKKILQGDISKKDFCSPVHVFFA